MLHYETIDTDTLVILQKLQELPELRETRLVGGTSLALQLGHRMTDILSLYKAKFPKDSEFIAIKSMTYFEDAEKDPYPTMLDNSADWQTMKQSILQAVKAL